MNKEIIKYTKLFWEFREVLVWSYLDLKEIPPNITKHRIHLLQMQNHFNERSDG